MDSDIVSVIIPTYNRAGFIMRSAKSVLSQTYKNLELIIVDDGSADNTAELVQELADADSRVRYIYQENKGACAARNNGIDHAHGKYIAFQDSDDVWHEDKLEKQIKVLNESGADFVFCLLSKIVDGKIVGARNSRYFSEGILSPSDMPLGGGTQTFCAFSDVFRNERFDENMPRAQDFEILLRISKKYKVYCMKEPLVDYFIQEDSISMNPEKALRAWNMIFQKNPDLLVRYKNSSERLALTILRNAVGADGEVRDQLIALAKRTHTSLKVSFKSILVKHKNLYLATARIYSRIKK